MTLYGLKFLVRLGKGRKQMWCIDFWCFIHTIWLH